jgi:hypothetical protein
MPEDLPCLKIWLFRIYRTVRLLPEKMCSLASVPAFISISLQSRQVQELRADFIRIMMNKLWFSMRKL